MVERLAHPHVVRDEIDYLTHAVRVKIRDPGIVVGAGTDGRVQLVVIGNVVTVQALRARLEIGRRITIADPERIEIRHDLPGLLKGELPIELQPVSRRWNAGMLLVHGKRRTGNLNRISGMDRIQMPNREQEEG
jgi:hypothetical protein